MAKADLRILFTGISKLPSKNEIFYASDGCFEVLECDLINDRNVKKISDINLEKESWEGKV